MVYCTNARNYTSNDILLVFAEIKSFHNDEYFALFRSIVSLFVLFQTYVILVSLYSPTLYGGLAIVLIYTVGSNDACSAEEDTMRETYVSRSNICTWYTGTPHHLADRQEAIAPCYRLWIIDSILARWSRDREWRYVQLSRARVVYESVQISRLQRNWIIIIFRYIFCIYCFL